MRRNHKSVTLGVHRVKGFLLGWIMHAIWLVLTWDLFEDGRINDVAINNLWLFKTNRFHVPAGLDSNRPQKASRWAKNISDTFLFLPHLGSSCDLLLNRRTATWNFFLIRYLKTTRNTYTKIRQRDSALSNNWSIPSIFNFYAMKIL